MRVQRTQGCDVGYNSVDVGDRTVLPLRNLRLFLGIGIVVPLTSRRLGIKDSVDPTAQSTRATVTVTLNVEC